MDNKNVMAACGSAVTRGVRDNTNDKGNKNGTAATKQHGQQNGRAVTYGDHTQRQTQTNSVEEGRTQNPDGRREPEEDDSSATDWGSSWERAQNSSQDDDDDKWDVWGNSDTDRDDAD